MAIGQGYFLFKYGHFIITFLFCWLVFQTIFMLSIILKNQITSNITKNELEVIDYNLKFNVITNHFIFDYNKQILIIIFDKEPPMIIEFKELLSCCYQESSRFKYFKKIINSHEIIISLNDADNQKLVFDLISSPFSVIKNRKSHKIISQFSNDLCCEINKIIQLNKSDI